MFLKHIASKLDLFEGFLFPRSLDLDLWKPPCETESVYALSLSAVRGITEEWTVIGVNSDVNEHAVLSIHHQLLDNDKTANNVSISFWADTLRYECRI